MVYTGSSSDVDRVDFIAAINSPNAAVSVGIMTFKAGGMGLNLTGANHVICTTHNYNPSTTLQSIGRTHRMG